MILSFIEHVIALVDGAVSAVLRVLKGNGLDTTIYLIGMVAIWWFLLR